MKRLYAPWRSRYSEKLATTKKRETAPDECVFCRHAQAQTEKQKNESYILFKTETCYIILNLYPYNAGHLLIIPIQHVDSLDKLKQSIRNELMELLTTCSTILKSTLKANGLNIGINLGQTAGAGIPSHLHIHVIPRWKGDTNFMPIIGETKVVSSNLNDIYKKLKPHFKL